MSSPASLLDTVILFSADGLGPRSCGLVIAIRCFTDLAAMPLTILSPAGVSSLAQKFTIVLMARWSVSADFRDSWSAYMCRWTVSTVGLIGDDYLLCRWSVSTASFTLDHPVSFEELNFLLLSIFVCPMVGRLRSSAGVSPCSRGGRDIFIGFSACSSWCRHVRRHRSSVRTFPMTRRAHDRSARAQRSLLELSCKASVFMVPFRHRVFRRSVDDGRLRDGPLLMS